MAILSNWKNWFRVTIILVIGFFLTQLVADAFATPENEED